MPHRYFTNDINGDRAFLSPDDARHFAQVCRGKAGDVIMLCNGQGSDYEARAISVSPQSVELEIITTFANVSEAGVSVTVYVGYPKGDKLEFIIQKATELGAVKIIPFFSSFCVVKPKNEQAKNERYNKIALEGAKQSGRGIIPKVEMPVSFNDMLKQINNYDIALFCYENGGDSIHSRINGVKTAALITGSEGGFSAQEAQEAESAGCIKIGLGPRILRCETAPIAALSAIMALSGNLQ